MINYDKYYANSKLRKNILYSYEVSTNYVHKYVGLLSNDSYASTLQYNVDPIFNSQNENQKIFF